MSWRGVGVRLVVITGMLHNKATPTQELRGVAMRLKVKCAECLIAIKAPRRRDKLLQRESQVMLSRSDRERLRDQVEVVHYL